MEHIRKDKIVNLPNALTALRIALLPAVVWRFRAGDMLGALGFYLLAMLTDAADGILARKLNQVTALGKLLDPLADKLSLLTLLWLFVKSGDIPLWVLFVELLREAALIAGGSVALHKGIVVYALPIGKVTTVCFVLSIVARFLGFAPVADALLYASVALSMVALVWYTVVLLGMLRKGGSERPRRQKF